MAPESTTTRATWRWVAAYSAIPAVEAQSVLIVYAIGFAAFAARPGFEHHDAEERPARRRRRPSSAGRSSTSSSVRSVRAARSARRDDGYQIRIGARVFANFGWSPSMWRRSPSATTSRSGRMFQLLTPTHPTDAGLRPAKWEAAAPITIGDNVWLAGA